MHNLNIKVVFIVLMQSPTTEYTVEVNDRWLYNALGECFFICMETQVFLQKKN